MLRRPRLSGRNGDRVLVLHDVILDLIELHYSFPDFIVQG